MKKQRNSYHRIHSSYALKTNGNNQWSGFTLVEMLVAVGLLMLIMSIMAQIFSLAAQTVRKQKGLANNDQKARIAFTVIQSDLMKMSYLPIESQKGEGITPVLPLSVGGADPRQLGYIYYSENDPDDDTDDVLQFTAKVNLAQSQDLKRDNTPFYGKANALSLNDQVKDQPDWDDGVFGNNLAASSMAEITYFYRKGVLYRQVKLIREPALPQSSNITLEEKAEPEDNGSPPSSLIKNDATDVYTGDFYNDFDFSAYFDDSYTDNTHDRLKFNSTLSNSVRSGSIGHPNRRTGFLHSDGLPLEFWNDGTNLHFFGRFTLEEASHADFDYPRINKTRADLVEGHDLTIFNNTGVLDGFSGGPRSRHDILLTQVLAFNVQIWDETTLNFVDLGDAGTDYVDANNQNTTYGPRGATGINRVFDTWSNESTYGTGLPPVRLLSNTSTSAYAAPAIADAVGTIYYNPAASSPYGHSNQLFFEIVEFKNLNGDSNVDFSGTQPEWSNFNLNSKNIVDGEVVWAAKSNLKPIKALRVTIRFKDLYSGQIRQMSIIHSFAE